MSLISFLGSGCKGSAQSGNNSDNTPIENMEADKFRDLITDTTIQLVDVRTPEEYAKGHIGNAKQISVSDDDFADRVDQELDKTRPVAVYCRSGARSAKAADILQRKGFTVYNLLGGYKGYPYK